MRARSYSAGPEKSEEKESQPVAPAFTPKALLVGSLLALLIGIGEPYNNMIVRGSHMALDFTTGAALFLFFLWVGVVNVVLGKISRALALNRAELIVVYVMMIVATAIPSMGLTEYFLPILVSHFYYATPENNWNELIEPYVPKWMVPQSPEAVKQFYEGLPKGTGLPWGAWIEPLLYWGVFLLALYFVMICMMVIIRRQWMERERLIYPIVQVPLEMTRESPGGGLVKPFFKNRAMWMGFVIPVIVGSIKALHHYYSVLPDVNLVSSIPVFRRTTSLTFSLSFPMVGFSYLINLEVAFSMWFFSLLSTAQRGFFRMTGIGSELNPGHYDFLPAVIAHQAMGGMIVLVLFGLWIGRSHLWDVMRKVLGRGEDVDDSGEMLSYRTAFWGTIGGLLFMGFWLRYSGLPAGAVVVFLFAAFLVFIGVTRVVCESGLALARAPMTPSSFVLTTMGSTALGPTGLTSLGFTFIWAADIRTFVMASCAHGLKLVEGIKGKRKLIFWAMMIAVVLAMAGSIWIFLTLSYRHGKINIGGIGGGQVPFNFVAHRMNNPIESSWEGWMTMGIGAGIMTALMIARQRFLWWPLHPLGYTMGGLMMMDYVWFSIFLAWLIKAAILKYGGPKTYRSLRPFFLGLILGQFTANGMWIVIDLFTGMTGNSIFWI